MPAKLLIKYLEDNDRECWDDFTRKSQMASIYHLSAWREVISDVFGHKTYYLMAMSESGEVEGVLPLVRLKSLLFGDYMVSIPFFTYGGALGNSADIEKALMDKATQSADVLGVQHVEFRDSNNRDSGLQVRDDKISMILDLPDSPDILLSSLKAKRRSQIKRPLRENPVIKKGGLELVDEFYEVFCRNMRDLGTPVYSRKFFIRILEVFPEHSRIISICLNGKPVAAGFLLGFQSTIEIPWASTIREVNPLGMNMLLYWEALKYSIESGYKHFDFGRCSVDSGTYRFKKQWGAQPRQLYWYYWMKDNAEMPDLTPHNPKYELAIKIWKKLPLFVTKLIGPYLVKNLP